MTRLMGTVRWFNEKKGFGFIDSGDEEYFVYFNAIQMEGYKTLKEAQLVTYVANKGEKGWFATEVAVI